jgi:hypothetical protein
LFVQIAGISGTAILVALLSIPMSYDLVRKSLIRRRVSG